MQEMNMETEPVCTVRAIADLVYKDRIFVPQALTVIEVLPVTSEQWARFVRDEATYGLGDD
jgi:hypothetical protein